MDETPMKRMKTEPFAEPGCSGFGFGMPSSASTSCVYNNPTDPYSGVGAYPGVGAYQGAGQGPGQGTYQSQFDSSSTRTSQGTGSSTGQTWFSQTQAAMNDYSSWSSQPSIPPGGQNNFSYNYDPYFVERPMQNYLANCGTNRVYNNYNNPMYQSSFFQGCAPTSMASSPEMRYNEYSTGNHMLAPKREQSTFGSCTYGHYSAGGPSLNPYFEYPVSNPALASSPHQMMTNRFEQNGGSSSYWHNPMAMRTPFDFFTGTVAERFLQIELALCNELMRLEFPDTVTHIYNPLDYAKDLHWSFLKKYLTGEKDVLFLGMNPGPFGMAQSGVPFGEVTHVRDWLGISGKIDKPPKEHPKKPIWGLDCPRKEISGARFWGYFQKACGTPETFFKSCFVHNICPLIFMSASGKNITPPDMKVCYRHPLTEVCDRALCATVRLLKPKVIVGVGKFAEERTRLALRSQGISGIKVKVIMHPSPANPAANKGWETAVQQQLTEMGVTRYFEKEEEIPTA